MARKSSISISSAPRHRGPIVGARPPNHSYAHPTRLDVWLQRASHIAQTAVLVVTAAALFYTVILLYEKALLDEEIARKEIRVVALERQVEQAYAEARKRTVHLYLNGAVAECQGLMEEPATYWTHPGGWSGWLLDRHLTECITSWTDRGQALSELRPEDRMFFEHELAKIGRALEPDRQAARALHATARERAAPDYLRITADLGKPGTNGELLLRNETPERRDLIRRRLAITLLEEAAGEQYRDAIRRRIMAIADLKLPSQSPAPD